MDKTETILFDLILNCNSVIDIRCRRDSHHFDYSAPVNTLVGFTVHSVCIYFCSAYCGFCQYCALRAHVRCKRLINTLLHYILHYIRYLCVSMADTNLSEG